VSDEDGASGSRTFVVSVLPSVFVLNPTAPGALTLSSNARIRLPGVVYVDSDSKAAIEAHGHASVRASNIDVVGKVRSTGHPRGRPAPHTGVNPIADPLSALAAPTSGTYRGRVTLGGNKSLTINPGVYSQITVLGNALLTMNPGVYIIAGGGFFVGGNGTVRGSGVMIYNAGSSFPSAGGNFHRVSVFGNAKVLLTAPTTGPYAGILIFQARDNTRALSVSGNSFLGLLGTIYAPAAALYLRGNSRTHDSLVVNRLTISGSAALTDHYRLPRLRIDREGSTHAPRDDHRHKRDLSSSVENRSRSLTLAEIDRVDAAIAAIDADVGQHGANLIRVYDALRSAADSDGQGTHDPHAVSFLGNQSILLVGARQSSVPAQPLASSNLAVPWSDIGNRKALRSEALILGTVNVPGSQGGRGQRVAISRQGADGPSVGNGRDFTNLRQIRRLVPQTEPSRDSAGPGQG
jgi:hypothetical protein